MTFLLFILVNFLLFVRPMDYMPGVMGEHLYVYVILACFVLSVPQVVQQLSGRFLEARPISVCILGLLAAILLSHLSHFNLTATFTSGAEFGKKVIYYLLLVSLVNTPVRLRRFLGCLACFFTLITALTVLEYKGVVTLETFQASVKDGAGFDGNTHQEIEVNRLKASGVFNDPNDFALVLVVGVPIALYFLTDRRLGILRLAWLVPLGLFVYALSLTYSRGGLIAFTAGLMVLMGSRFGVARALALGAVLLPMLALVFGGRQTDISTNVNTGQERVDLWASGLVMFQTAPLFGTGENTYSEEAGQVAHNSYVHCYTELGFFGGTLFLGAFYFAFLTLRRFGAAEEHILHPEMRRLRSFLLAAVTAYATGLMTLSNSYIEPTYAMFGLVTAYAQVTVVYPPLPMLRLDMPRAQRLALVSACFLLSIYLFVRMFHSV